MQFDAVILGASGYGGGELLRWLSQHPNVARVRGTSRSLGGEAFAEAHPNLRGVVPGNFENAIAWRDFSGSEELVVFSALPHGELAKLLPDLETEWRAAEIYERLLLLDLSADFRASDDFVYGLPEWNRGALAGARRIACPGCFATALELALLPLRGLEVGFIAASAVTGSSGSGTAASAGTHHPMRANDFRAYKVLTHQHLAEVRMAMAACAIKGHLAFVPQSGPFVRGIFATVQFALPGVDLIERVRATFADEPFVRLVETSPRVAAVTGSNFADLSLAMAEGSAAIMVALDNLGKGMASQAVQAMNLALGLPETTGLFHAGRFPA
ncbi:MAG: N-acetyl-gamma-glutamyl-phosphate reductase [Chthoniobacterales bacterium]